MQSDSSGRCHTSQEGSPGQHALPLMAALSHDQNCCIPRFRAGLAEAMVGQSHVNSLEEALASLALFPASLQVEVQGSGPALVQASAQAAEWGGVAQQEGMEGGSCV